MMNEKNQILLSTLEDAAAQDGWHSGVRKYSHESVCAAQAALGIPADGVIGSQVSEAIRIFQAREGAEQVDGFLGPETFRLLAEAYAVNGTLLDDSDLAEIQSRLTAEEAQLEVSSRNWHAILYNRKKAYPKEIIRKIQKVLGVEADGIIGFGTVERLREWQASRGLQADGRIGPDTLKEFFPSNSPR